MVSSLYAQINRMLDPLRNSIKMMLCKAIANFIDDSTDIQLVQIDYAQDATKDKVQRPQQYGLTTKPLPGAQLVMAFLNGNRDHGVVLITEDTRYRFKNLPDGGVVLYDYAGNYVRLTNDAGIEIEAPTEKVTIKAAGDIEIGNASVKKLVNETFVALFNSHTHTYIPALDPAPLPIPSGGPSSLMSDIHTTSKVKAE